MFNENQIDKEKKREKAIELLKEWEKGLENKNRSSQETIRLKETKKD